MTIQHLHWPGGPLRGAAQLPASKSEANRALLLQRLAGGGTLTNLSEAHDTVLMQRLLAQAAATDQLDAEDAGTVMRFMTAYLAVTGWRGTLTGAARMKQRPIGILVEALRQLGAGIEYVEREGYPPLRFAGGGRAAATAELAGARRHQQPVRVGAAHGGALPARRLAPAPDRRHRLAAVHPLDA
ncbi:MAG: hypothetical protein WKG07_46780 [Hymenobacter sp.]